MTKWETAGCATLLTLGLTLPASGQSPGVSFPGASGESAAALARGEWPAYAGTYASARYSPLDQIDASNAGSLKIAWRWVSPDHAVGDKHGDLDPAWYHEGTPVMVNSVLYTSTSLWQVAAIDAATGQTKWVFDPGAHRLGMPANNGWLHRGVAYWRDGADERVIMVTGHASMIALDARSGRPIESFGDKGRVDLQRRATRRSRSTIAAGARAPGASSRASLRSRARTASPTRRKSSSCGRSSTRGSTCKTS